MLKNIAISVMGKDRPGIVAAISRILFETGCNIEDSSMTLIGNEFAMILIVDLPQGMTVEFVRKSLEETGSLMGLSIFVRAIEHSEIKHEKRVGKPYVISVYGADKTGIVYKITKLLADLNINITDVQTNISRTGKPAVYIMLLEVDLPDPVNPENLKKKLESVAGEIQVSVSIHPIEEPEL